MRVKTWDALHDLSNNTFSLWNVLLALWLKEKQYQNGCSQSAYSTPIYIIPDEWLIVGHLQQLPTYELGVMFSLSSHDKYTQCKRGHLCQWASRTHLNFLWLTGLHHSFVKMLALGGIEHSCLCIVCGSGHHHYHWTAGGGPDFPQGHLFWQDCIISQLPCRLRAPPWLAGARLYPVVLSQFSVFTAFIVIALLNRNFNLKSLTKYLCGVNFSCWFTFKPARFI